MENNHHMPSTSNNASSSSANGDQPDFSSINFSVFEQNNNDTNSTEQRISKYRRNTDYDIQNDEEISKDDKLWETAQNNEWYRWATFTAKETGKENYLLCSKSPLNKVIAVPNPHDYLKCALLFRRFCKAILLS